MSLSRELILHLSLLDGIGPAVVQSIIKKKKSGVYAPDFYFFSVSDWRREYELSERCAHNIVAGLQDKKILESELQRIEKNDIQWTTVIDESYPSLLREIYLPPSILYWKGSEFTNIEKMIAVVGSRTMTSYGQRAVNRFVPELVSQGWCIVSGGAVGVDTAAHKAAIAAGGKTVAVLGSGLLRLYPQSNNRLFESIIESGGIITSSFSTTMPPLSNNFPARNRIISGLSRGCLVVQAAEKSGALITAHYALDQGREVFAIPGPIDNESSIGCHKLIQSGAKLVTTSADILQEFGEYSVGQFQKDNVVVAQPTALQQSIFVDTSLSEVQRKIMDVCKNPVSCDDIVRLTQLSLPDVQVELFDLQISGKIKQDFSGMWIVIN